MVDYQQGDVTKPGEQKPKGEASRLNDSMMPAAPEQALGPDPGPPIPLKQPQPLPPPAGEDALLYGPTSRPGQPVTTQRNSSEVPGYIFDSLPAIVRAAQMPDASPALKALVRLLDFHTNGA